MWSAQGKLRSLSEVGHGKPSNVYPKIQPALRWRTRRWQRGRRSKRGTNSITSPSDSSLEEAEDHDEKRWGSDDPTRASFAFSHGLALADAGHEVQIFLTGEATYLMRKATVDAVKPIGWPPLSETMEKIVSRKIPVFS